MDTNSCRKTSMSSKGVPDASTAVCPTTAKSFVQTVVTRRRGVGQGLTLDETNIPLYPGKRKRGVLAGVELLGQDGGSRGEGDGGSGHAESALHSEAFGTMRGLL